MIQILVNEISQEGMRRVRVISDRRVSEASMLEYVPGAAQGFAKVKCEDTSALSLFYGEVVYPAREMVVCRAACIDGRARRLAVWKLVPSEGYRVSEIVEFLAEWYFVQTHVRPQFAFMNKLPAGVESGVWGVEDVVLFEAEWALHGCVMVGG